MTSTDRSVVLERIRVDRLIGIVRSADSAAALAHARHLLATGISLVEVALTTPNALEVVRQLADETAGTDAIIGVGTCLDGESTRRSVDAGARFALAPSAAPGMIAAALELGIVAVPAALTPTEAVYVADLGADLVKLFPASVVGTAGLRAYREPLPDIEFVATGGVSFDNAADWIGAGAVAVGMGGGLKAADVDTVRRLRDDLQRAGDAR